MRPITDDGNGFALHYGMMKPMTTRSCRLLLLLAVLSGLAPVARADEAAPASAPAAKSSFRQFLEQDYLFGNWGGGRTWLSERGVDFEFFYIGTMPRNISGGLKTGTSYEGALLMLLDLDSKKLVGYEGGHLHMGGVWLHGQDHFSDRNIGDLNKVNLIDFPNAARLWELWYEQKFLDDKWSLKFGQMAVDQDFIKAEYYNSLASINLHNQTFFYPTLAFNVYDIPGFPVGHHALPSSPYGAPGALLRWSATDRVYVQAAAYDGFPEQSGSGARINLNQEEGALIYFETGYKLNQRQQDSGLPGNIKLGAYYHTDDFSDMYSVVTGSPTVHSGTWGGYLLLDQMLYREVGKNDPAQQGLVGFFRVTGAPPDRNLTQFGLDGGLGYKGLIPTRDYDSLSIAGSYLQMSRDLRRGQNDVNSIFPGYFPALVDYEGVFEVNYKAQLTAWWTANASVQRVFHPGGSAAIRDAWAFILGTTLRF